MIRRYVFIGVLAALGLFLIHCMGACMYDDLAVHPGHSFFMKSIHGKCYAETHDGPGGSAMILVGDRQDNKSMPGSLNVYYGMTCDEYDYVEYHTAFKARHKVQYVIGFTMVILVFCALMFAIVIMVAYWASECFEWITDWINRGEDNRHAEE